MPVPTFRSKFQPEKSFKWRQQRGLIFGVNLSMFTLVEEVGEVLIWRLSSKKLQETQNQSLGWEDPLEKEMATHSSILAWRIPWTEEPGRLQSMGLQRVGHDLATKLQRLQWGVSQMRESQYVCCLDFKVYALDQDDKPSFRNKQLLQCPLCYASPYNVIFHKVDILRIFASPMKTLFEIFMSSEFQI